MKIKMIFFACFVFVFVFYSCKDKDASVKTFSSSLFLRADSILINEVIKFGDIYKLDDYILIRDAYENNIDFFYVYSFPEFGFLYSFAKKGNGPDEYLMPTVIKNMPGNSFGFRDHFSDKIAIYEITDTLALLKNSFDVLPQSNRFFWEINYINDSLFLLKNTDNNKWSRRELWNLKEKKIIDSIPNTFDLEKKLGKDYFSIFDDYWIASKNNKFVFGYFFIDLLELGTIENNKINIKQSIGAKTPPKFFLYKETRGGKYQHNVENNIVYNGFITCTNDYIYALYAGFSWGEQEEIHSQLIEVYDWNGGRQKLLKLDQAISHFIVDEESKTLYGFNTIDSEDFILRFRVE